MGKKLFITGIGRGIGKGLVELYLKEGWEVFGVGRSNPFGKEVEFVYLDLRSFEKIWEKLEGWSQTKFDLAILNAGILGEIKELREWSIWELEEVMGVNVWANKVLIDWLGKRVEKIVAISSGAGVNGNRGWGGYSISKASLNMLVKIYSQEITPSIYALAPGVIETDMVRKVISGDKTKFPSLHRVDQGKVSLQKGVEMVKRGIELLDRYPSGSYVDVRDLPLALR